MCRSVGNAWSRRGKRAKLQFVLAPIGREDHQFRILASVRELPGVDGVLFSLPGEGEGKRAQLGADLEEDAIVGPHAEVVGPPLRRASRAERPHRNRGGIGRTDLQDYELLARIRLLPRDIQADLAPAHGPQQPAHFRRAPEVLEGPRRLRWLRTRERDLYRCLVTTSERQGCRL